MFVNVLTSVEQCFCCSTKENNNWKWRHVDKRYSVTDSIHSRRRYSDVIKTWKPHSIRLAPSFFVKTMWKPWLPIFRLTTPLHYSKWLLNQGLPHDSLSQLILDLLWNSRTSTIKSLWFFSKKNILIPNVAEKNILILVEEKKKFDSEFLSYNLMINSGKKNFALCATKKIYSNSCVVRKKNSERNKKP